MVDFTSIRQSVDNVRDSVESLGCGASEAYRNDIRSELDSIESELDQFEADESDEFSELIPTNLSVGEADSLKEVIRKWRTDNGYSNN